MTTLPETLRRYFWDVDPGALSVDGHRDWIIGRLLHSGGSDAVRWLRREVGDRELTLWLRRMVRECSREVREKEPLFSGIVNSEPCGSAVSVGRGGWWR